MPALLMRGCRLLGSRHGVWRKRFACGAASGCAAVGVAMLAVCKEIAELGACAEERSDGALAPNYEISLQRPPQGQSIEQFAQS
jgi:hypothetical protein